jgi:hypothetical protein
MIGKVIKLGLVVAVVAGGMRFVAGGTADALELADRSKRVITREARSLRAGVINGVEVTDKRLSEISGCAVGQKNPGVVWVHNDSGDGPLLYAIRASDGVTVASVKLLNVEARDFEDMSIANGRLYVGDIGDNLAKNPNVSIISVAEPKLTGTKYVELTLKPTVRTLTYSEGPRDAEAMFIDPNGSPVIIDKVDATVWRAKKGSATLDRVATLDMPLVTGAALSRDGKDLLLRTYLSVLRYSRSAKAPFDSIYSASPALVDSPFLPQAEAVCTGPGKTGYTISEARGRTVKLIPIRW